MACIQVSFERIGGITAEFERQGGIQAEFSPICGTSLGENVLFDSESNMLTEAEGKILIGN